MSRVKLRKGQQGKFLNRVAKHFNDDWFKVAKISSICDRTLNGWRREKCNMRYETLLKLHRTSKIPMPKIIEVLPEHWSVKKASRLGAIKRNELYGNPGTPEGRSRGGSVSAKRFREDPEFARMLRFKLRTPMEIPSYSSELAEFIGIMLGDGHIKTNKTQLEISLNSETDYVYALYVQSLINKLFRLNSSLCEDGREKSVTVLVSSRNLVEFMLDRGLRAGNKVVNQVGVPCWVNSKEEYKVACLKGLMDTDGSFYAYSHRVNGKVYKNYALDFTNRSVPLLKAVKEFLIDIGCFPTSAKFKVVLYKKKDIRRYINTVGTSNPSRRDKFGII